MTPFSCEECRAQLAALTNDANPSARPKPAASTTAVPTTTAVDEMSPEAAAHLQSCDKCRIEYSMLRGIVAELRALPAFAAPPDLRARISHQIALEAANEVVTKVATVAAVDVRQTAPRATPQHALPLRSLLPRLFIPRWATYSLSGALATAFLLFVARDINSDFAPNQGSQDTSSSVQQTAPSQLPPATKRVAPAPKGKTPSATNNRAKSKSLSDGASPEGSSSKKVAPVPLGSAFGAPSSTRSAPTLPADNAPAATEGAVNTSTHKTPATQARAAQAFKRAAPTQTAPVQPRSDVGNSSVSRSSAPQIVAPEEPSAPLLLPSPPDNAAEAARRNKLGTASNAGAPNAPVSSASARTKTTVTSSASAKRFARLELLPPSAAPSPLQKVQPTRAGGFSMRRQDSLGNAQSMSKSAAKGAGALDANGSTANASSADASSATSGNASAGNSSVSGALSSAQSSTRSTETSAARSGQNANQSADAALPSQHDEGVYRNRVADQEARGAAAQSSAVGAASAGKAPSTTQSERARAARGSLAPSTSSASSAAPTPGARAGAQSGVSDRDSKAEKASDTASQQAFATADGAAADATSNAIATPLRKPLSPLSRKSRARTSGVSARSANGLNQENLADKTRQDARLIVMPRQNASRARVVVVWTSGLARAKKISLVVWQGAARRNQEIVVSLAAPRGNKNRRAQVSLQSANARGEWQTLDTTVLSATSTAR